MSPRLRKFKVNHQVFQEISLWFNLFCFPFMMLMKPKVKDRCFWCLLYQGRPVVNDMGQINNWINTQCCIKFIMPLKILARLCSDGWDILKRVNTQKKKKKRYFHGRQIRKYGCKYRSSIFLQVTVWSRQYRVTVLEDCTEDSAHCCMDPYQSLPSGEWNNW